MHENMKKILLITLVLAALAGCSKSNAWRSKDFTHTGCAAETRSGLDNDKPSLLTLKYEGGDLRVTLTNIYLSCDFKDRGLVCDVRVKGNDIYYRVDYEKQAEGFVNCICPVEKLTSAVTDLEVGKEYSLHYSVLYYTFNPVTFKFKKGLHQIIDTDTLND